MVGCSISRITALSLDLRKTWHHPVSVLITSSSYQSGRNLTLSLYLHFKKSILQEKNWCVFNPAPGEMRYRQLLDIPPPLQLWSLRPVLTRFDRKDFILVSYSLMAGWRTVISIGTLLLVCALGTAHTQWPQKSQTGSSHHLTLMKQGIIFSWPNTSITWQAANSDPYLSKRIAFRLQHHASAEAESASLCAPTQTITDWHGKAPFIIP